jgi:16S rRNA (uracil1498-N3)-methyltransferase
MKQLPRFAIPGVIGDDRVVRLAGNELHHLRDVRRLGPGAEVVLCTADGSECVGRIEAFEPSAAIISITGKRENQPAETRRTILAPALIKASRMDLLVEKAAELNATELWPLFCARSVARDPGAERYQRWRRIAIAAAKQSLRSPPMEIRPPLDLLAMVQKVPEHALCITCVAGAEPLASLLRRRDPPAIVLVCGPEGDFTEEEISAMRTAGFVLAGLGPNRLRSETAALAALSIAAGIFDELRHRSPAPD